MIVIAATQNKHKIAEIQAITGDFGFEIKTLPQMGFEPVDVVEDGDTFEANSLKKAMEIHQVTGMVTIADDSGLMVDYLEGAPGVYSARFAGEESSDEKNNEKLLKLMKDVPAVERGAAFVSVITMVFSENQVISARGECSGHILYEKRGEGGFGYDPLFVPQGYDRSYAELSAEEKNTISHRAKALKNLALQLEEKAHKSD